MIIVAIREIVVLLFGCVLALVSSLIVGNANRDFPALVIAIVIPIVFCLIRVTLVKRPDSALSGFRHFGYHCALDLRLYYCCSSRRCLDFSGELLTFLRLCGGSSVDLEWATSFSFPSRPVLDRRAIRHTIGHSTLVPPLLPRDHRIDTSTNLAMQRSGLRHRDSRMYADGAYRD